MSNGAEIIARRLYAAQEKHFGRNGMWSDLHPDSRRVFIAAVVELLDKGVIVPGIEHDSKIYKVKG